MLWACSTRFSRVRLGGPPLYPAEARPCPFPWLNRDRDPPRARGRHSFRHFRPRHSCVDLQRRGVSPRRCGRTRQRRTTRTAWCTVGPTCIPSCPCARSDTRSLEVRGARLPALQHLPLRELRTRIGGRGAHAGNSIAATALSRSLSPHPHPRSRQIAPRRGSRA